MADRQQRFALLSRFDKYVKMADLPPQNINKYNEQWAADALLESFNLDDIYNAMSYYFEINQRPTWKGFANNVDRLIQSMQAREDDIRLRKEMRLKAKEWLNES